MDADQIRQTVRRFDTTDMPEVEAVWDQLRPLGATVLPFFVEEFPRIKKWQGREAMVYHAIKFARTSDLALRLAEIAAQDRSRIVRYRATQLLAYSLKQEALPILQKLLSHPDAKTTEDARAAIDAIVHQNHNYFMDRAHSGSVKWEVTPS